MGQSKQAFTVMLESLSPFWLWFGVIVLGYLLQSWALLWLFYSGRDHPSQWKTQPALTQTVGKMWLPPLFSSKPGRAPWHRWICTFNLVVAGAFAGVVAERISAGRSKLVSLPYSQLTLHGGLQVLLETGVCIVYESVVEYYWHRLMHIPFFYTHFHKMHHAYKSPEVFDDMYIHPLEAFGYYLILYAPPFLFPVSLNAFVLYMVIMGICGVLDHAGIRIAFPSVYDSTEHDLHHSRTNVNYGFPTTHMDRLHGTFVKPPAGAS